MHSLVKHKFGDDKSSYTSHYGVLKVDWLPDMEYTPDKYKYYELTQDIVEWTKILEILDDMEVHYVMLDGVPPGNQGRNFKADLAQEYFGLDINYYIDNVDPCKPDTTTGNESTTSRSTNE